MLPALQEIMHARLNHALCIYSLITLISEGSIFFFCKKSDSISHFPAMQEVLQSRLHHARLWLLPPLVLGQRQWQVLFNSFCLLPYLSLFWLLQFSYSNSPHMKVLSSFISERDIYLATWQRERVILRICAFVRGHSNFSQRTRTVRRVFTLNTMSHLAAATVLLLARRFFSLYQERM